MLLSQGASNFPGIDTLVSAVISIALGILALISASRAKRESALVENRTVNLQAFEQAQKFYDTTNQRLMAQGEQLSSENAKLTEQNRKLTRQLDRLEELIEDLGGVVPPEDPNGASSH